MGTKAGEGVLIVTDMEKKSIREAIFEKAVKIDLEIIILVEIFKEIGSSVVYLDYSYEHKS